MLFSVVLVNKTTLLQRQMRMLEEKTVTWPLKNCHVGENSTIAWETHYYGLRLYLYNSSFLRLKLHTIEGKGGDFDEIKTSLIKPLCFIILICSYGHTFILSHMVTFWRFKSNNSLLFNFSFPLQLGSQWHSWELHSHFKAVTPRLKCSFICTCTLENHYVKSSCLVHLFYILVVTHLYHSTERL